VQLLVLIGPGRRVELTLATSHRGQPQELALVRIDGACSETEGLTRNNCGGGSDLRLLAPVQRRAV
jgi:hypothetical protein